ncbi:8151_t:CDS:2, partial [Cetraspora pellucida]
NGRIYYETLRLNTIWIVVYYPIVEKCACIRVQEYYLMLKEIA